MQELEGFGIVVAVLFLVSLGVYLLVSKSTVRELAQWIAGFAALFLALALVVPGL